MPTPYISDREYLRRASTLKKFGLVDYDLRKNLTPGQKGNITKLTMHHIESVTDSNGNTKKINRPPLKSLINNPELFKTRKVNKKQADKWRQSGYKIINNHVVVRGEVGATITVFPTRIILKRKLITETIYTFGSKEFFKQAKSLLNKKLAKGEYISGRFGNFGIFKTQFTNYEDFYRYISERTDEFTDEITQTLQLVHTVRNKPEEEKPAVKAKKKKPIVKKKKSIVKKRKK